MDDRYLVETPENVELTYEIAGIGSRFVAALVDITLLVVMEVALFIVVTLVNVAATNDDIILGAGISVIEALQGALSFALIWVYYIGFEMLWNGQTPGKRMSGLRVVLEGGRPISFVASAVRNFLRIVDFLPALYGLGVLVMFVDRRARRLGDLAAGTLTVKERSDITLESLTRPDSSVPVATAITLPNLHLLDDRDYALVMEFLQRRGGMAPDVRQRVGRQLASGVQSRLGLPQGGDAETLLSHVASQYQLGQQRGVTEPDTPPPAEPPVILP